MFPPKPPTLSVYKTGKHPRQCPCIMCSTLAFVDTYDIISFTYVKPPGEKRPNSLSDRARERGKGSAVGFFS